MVRINCHAVVQVHTGYWAKNKGREISEICIIHAHCQLLQCFLVYTLGSARGGGGSNVWASGASPKFLP